MTNRSAQRWGWMQRTGTRLLHGLMSLPVALVMLFLVMGGLPLVGLYPYGLKTGMWCACFSNAKPNGAWHRMGDGLWVWTTRAWRW